MAVSSTTRKPEQSEAPIGERNAQLCGLISGLPAEFNAAVGALENIKRRADKAIEYGLLNSSRAEKISAISADALAIRGTLVDLWKIVDGIIAAGITLPEMEMDIEL